MMRIVAMVLLVLAAFGMPAAHAENVTIRKAVDGFVRPSYGQLRDATARLSTAMEHLCAKPGAEEIAAARSRFLETLAGWSAVESLRLGPITEQNRLERFVYWPDRKGIGMKQIQAAIAGNDPSVESPATLAGKSVAMQGLGALDFVLYGTGADALATSEGGHRCRYGGAIAGNLAHIAADVSAAWDDPAGFARQWSNPSPDNALYRSDAEAMNDLLDVFVQGLEQIRDTRLNPFLGETPGQDKPRQAIFWRSQATVLSFDAGMAGLKGLFDASGLGGLAAGENAYIGQSINFEFSNADRALKSVMSLPVADALSDESARGKLVYFRVVTSSLSDLFANKLAAALGLTAGFSSLDGD